jgi:hypothetical protein
LPTSTLTPDERSLRASLAADASWGKTVNRTARTRRARAESPGEIAYWLARLGPEFAEATVAQKYDAAEAMRSSHFKRLALKSARARARRGGDPDAVIA